MRGRFLCVYCSARNVVAETACFFLNRVWIGGNGFSSFFENEARGWLKIVGSMGSKIRNVSTIGGNKIIVTLSWKSVLLKNNSAAFFHVQKR